MARCWLEQTVSSGCVELSQAGTVVGDGNRVCGPRNTNHLMLLEAMLGFGQLL